MGWRSEAEEAYESGGIDAVKRLFGEEDEPLALYFTPGAIRDHFDGDEDEIGKAIADASDEQLREVGECCIGADTLYSEFHRLLVDGAGEVLGVE